MHVVKWVFSIALFAGCFIACPVFAQNVKLEVKLHSLEVVHTQEKGGDELYISVTEFPLNEPARHYQIPTYPTHWLSKYLTNVKDVVIWQKSINQCEPVDLLISLVEEDFAPWNADDTLGSIKLQVECVNGKAVEKWIIPDPKTTSKSKEIKNGFTFTGDGAEYKAIFNLEGAIKN